MAQAARLIINASPAAHVDGGAPPGAAELARRTGSGSPGQHRAARDRAPDRRRRAVNDRQPTGGPDLLLGLAGRRRWASAPCCGAAAAASAWLTGHRVPSTPGLLAGYPAFAHLGDPRGLVGARSGRRLSTGPSLS